MPKGFSEEEKITITHKLLAECKKNWQIYGYKKTSIDVLCQNAGISKGAFYVFFDSKESLFYQVITQTQAQLYELVEQHLSENPSKYGIAKALKEVFAEYCNSSFMYDTKNTDFQAFLNKLSKEQRNQLNDLGHAKTEFMLRKPFLKLKIEEKLAMSILTAMLTVVSQKDNIPSNITEVFSFMIDNLIEKIFE